MVPDLVTPWHVGSSWIKDRTLSPAVAGRFFTTEPPRRPIVLLLFFNIYLLICFWLCWVLVVACRIFTAVCEHLSSYGAQAPECMGSVLASSGLSCPLACGILVPQPGIEPPCAALEGRFLITGSPGKSLNFLLMPQVMDT